MCQRLMPHSKHKYYGIIYDHAVRCHVECLMAYIRPVANEPLRDDYLCALHFIRVARIHFKN